MDEYALRSLEKARISQLSASSNNVITAWALAPFKPWNAIPEAERDILATFVQASNVMDNSIQRLIIEAEAVLRDLDDLENRLHLIQDMVSREDSVIKEQHNEIVIPLFPNQPPSVADETTASRALDDPRREQEEASELCVPSHVADEYRYVPQ